MKISEMIERLAHHLARHGDVPVVDADCYEFTEITLVEAGPDDPSAFVQIE